MESLKPSEEINLKLKENETIYTMRFSNQNNALNVDITEEESSSSIKYISNFNLAYLQKKNKYFDKFDKLEELIPEIKNLCDENKINQRKKYHNNKISIAIKGRRGSKFIYTPSQLSRRFRVIQQSQRRFGTCIC